MHMPSYIKCIKKAVTNTTHIFWQLLSTDKKICFNYQLLNVQGMHIPVYWNRSMIYDDPDTLLGPAVSGLATRRSFNTLDTPDTFHAA